MRGPLCINNIERKQRIIDEKQYIAAKNLEARKRKERRKARKTKLRQVSDEMLIRVEDNELNDSSLDSYTKLFTPSYFQDISYFKQNFSKGKIVEEGDVGSTVSSVPKKTKVFNYLENHVNPKPVILSRNILEHVNPTRDSLEEKDSQGKEKENGWTKLLKFFSEESSLLKHTCLKDASLSITDIWKRENEEKKAVDKHFDIDLSQASSTRQMKETMRKYYKETQEFKDGSTNLATTLEATSAEKNKVSKEKIPHSEAELSVKSKVLRF